VTTPTPTPAPAAPAAVPATSLRRALGRNRSVLFGYLLVLVLAAAGEIVSRGFLRVNHIDELIISGGFIALVGLGQTFVILTGGVDLSIPWVLNASAIYLTLWASGDSAKMVWIVPVLLGGAAVVGAVNGIGVAYLRIPPIIMTLGMSGVVEGALLLSTNGGSGGNAPNAAVYLATHRWGPLPVLAVLWIAVLLISTVVLSKTPFGRRLYATGLNQRVATFAGVNVQFVTVAVYVISAIAAALAGIALAGYVGQSYLGMGDPYLFASVAAVAIGGTSILGGSGNFVGTTAGALALAVLAALLPILGLQPAALEIVYGCVILAAVMLSSLRTDRSGNAS
jgi:ribose transport system permease protein